MVWQKNGIRLVVNRIGGSSTGNECDWKRIFNCDVRFAEYFPVELSYQQFLSSCIDLAYPVPTDRSSWHWWGKKYSYLLSHSHLRLNSPTIGF